MLVQPSGRRAKAFGAFYTDEAIAAFLSSWAVRDSSARVLDPSFGGGVFLDAAASLVRELGGSPSKQIFGVELDAIVHETVSAELSASYMLDRRNLILSDFFAVDPSVVPEFDAVVGNPPFIRYQSFAGSVRDRALQRAAAQGVTLSSLSSSWAPFLVHSAAMLRRGGNLAMVLPMELGHAGYARPVLDYLSRTFSKITILTFRVPLFPDLSQDTLLLLAEGKGGAFETLGWQDLNSLEELNGLDKELSDRQVLDHDALSSGADRFITAFVDPKARDLYRLLAGSRHTVRLIDVAQVGIGYVTGANEYFHLSPASVSGWQLPGTVLSRSVFRGRALSGLAFTEEDWRLASAEGTAGYLLNLGLLEALDDKTRSYISHGLALGVNSAYKCRVREPWYSVPGVYLPDAFLTYMSGLRPRLVKNSASAVAPNTLHTVRMKPLSTTTPTALALAWQSSLVSLSVEIEGHAMGGGMLKLEPREAQRVVVPVTSVDTAGLEQEVDRLVRSDRVAVATHLVDAVVLRDTMGLTRAECELLASAAEQLRSRRYHRGRAA